MSLLGDTYQEPEFLAQMFDRVNSTLNKDLLDFNRLREASECLLREQSNGGQFTEAAMQYLTEGLTSWGKNGSLLGPFYQSIAALDFRKANQQVIPVEQIHRRFGVIEEGTSAETPLKLSISPLKFPEWLPWLSHAAFFV